MEEKYKEKSKGLRLIEEENDKGWVVMCECWGGK
jgi:hypothetical protein